MSTSRLNPVTPLSVRVSESVPKSCKSIGNACTATKDLLKNLFCMLFGRKVKLLRRLLVKCWQIRIVFVLRTCLV